MNHNIDNNQASTDETFFPLTPEEIARDLYIGGYTDHLTGDEANQEWKEAHGIKHIKAYADAEVATILERLLEQSVEAQMFPPVLNKPGFYRSVKGEAVRAEAITAELNKVKGTQALKTEEK